jgi:hypothetical protein
VNKLQPEWAPVATRQDLVATRVGAFSIQNAPRCTIAKQYVYVYVYICVCVESDTNSDIIFSRSFLF